MFGGFGSEYYGVYVMPIDGTGDPTLRVTGVFHVTGWSAADVLLGPASGDIWTQAGPAPDNLPAVLVNSESTERWPTFSPEGNWIAYASNSTGQDEVYVRTYPDDGAVYPVTRGNGGTRPRWSRDGSQIFYRTGANEGRQRMMAVTVSEMANGIAFGDPEELFDKLYTGSSPFMSYDVASDGRFLMLPAFAQATTRVNEITFVRNWLDELQRRIPTGGGQ